MGPCSRALSFLAFVALAVPHGLAAQSDRGATGFAFEISSTERRLYPRQSAEFARFTPDHAWIHVDEDSVAPEPHRRTLRLSFRQASSGNGAGLTVDASGAVVRVSSWLEPPMIMWYESPTDSVWHSHLDYFKRASRPRGFSLPEQRIWDLVPVVPPGRVAVGSRWVDTLDLSATAGEFEQTLTGVRTTMVLRDTVVDGRSLWLMRDSLDATSRERFLARERTLDDFGVMERTGRGIHRGTFLYDPSLRLYRERWDSTSLTEQETLTLPDGRAFLTPTRFQRTREIHLRDSAATVARRAELQDERRRRRVGMLSLPSVPLQERLRAGEEAAIDSLVDVVRRGPDAADRRAALELLFSWARPDEETELRYRELGLAMGDTVGYLSGLRGRRLLGWQIPFSVDELSYALPLMEDPGLAHAFGMSEEPFYENIRQGLLARPPAVTEDTASWTCEPAACRLLERQWWDAREPRLRDLGLLALFVSDPASWADTVLSRSERSA